MIAAPKSAQLSVVQWMPKGAVKKRPARMELSEAERAMLEEKAGLKRRGGPSAALSEDATPEERAKAAASHAAHAASALAGRDKYGLPLELDMENYDNEDAEGEDMLEEEDLDALADLDEGDSDDEGSDAEDFIARPKDCFLLAAQASDEHSVLEVYVYDEDTSNLFVHHDITLPAFPLSLAWMDCAPRAGAGEEVGSFVAVGTFHPAIEIWNLDVIDSLEPAATLGGLKDGPEGKKKKGKKGKKKAPKQSLVPGSHAGAVLALAWNRTHRQLLASASDDATVKLWDVTTRSVVHTYTHHSEPVNALAWHYVEGNILATGSFDRTVRVLDASKPSGATANISLDSPLECLAWNPNSPSHLAVGCKDGALLYFDVRNTSVPVWKVPSLSGDATSALTFSPLANGLLATASEDGSVRLWDVEGAAPALMGSKDMGVGKLFSVSFYQNSPFLLAAGGESDKLIVWETDMLSHLPDRFAGRLLEPAAAPGAFARSRPDGQKLTLEEDAVDDAVAGGGVGVAGAGAGAGAGAAAGSME